MGLICFIHVRAFYFNLHIFIVNSSLKKYCSGYFRIANSDFLLEYFELFQKRKIHIFMPSWKCLRVRQGRGITTDVRSVELWLEVPGGHRKGVRNVVGRQQRIPRAWKGGEDHLKCGCAALGKTSRF